MGVMSRKRFLRGGAAVVFALGFAAEARAQNLLSNPGFNANVSSWNTNIGAAVSWQPLDAGRSLTSGSALVTNNSVDPSMGTGLFQCRPATAGQLYDFGVKVRIPSGQTNTGAGLAVLAWSTSQTCASNSFISNTATPAIDVFDRWKGTAASAMAPAGTVAVFFECYQTKTEAGGSIGAYFDDAFLAPAGSLRATRSETRTVPVASIHGANRTFFHSDAWITDRSLTNSTDAPVGTPFTSRRGPGELMIDDWRSRGN